METAEVAKIVSELAEIAKTLHMVVKVVESVVLIASSVIGDVTKEEISEADNMGKTALSFVSGVTEIGGTIEELRIGLQNLLKNSHKC